MLLHNSIHSLVIAQVLGMYFVIMALVMIARADHYRALIAKLQPDSGIVPLAASVGLVFGLLLVVVHNLWLWESEVVITVIAWLILIKSVLWLAIPERMVTFSRVIYSGNAYFIVAVITGLIGIALLTHHANYLLL